MNDDKISKKSFDHFVSLLESLSKGPGHILLDIKRKDWTPSSYDELRLFVYDTIKEVNRIYKMVIEKKDYILSDQHFLALDRYGKHAGYTDGGGFHNDVSSCVHTLEWELVRLMNTPLGSFPVSLELQIIGYKEMNLLQDKKFDC